MYGTGLLCPSFGTSVRDPSDPRCVICGTAAPYQSPAGGHPVCPVHARLRGGRVLPPIPDQLVLARLCRRLVRRGRLKVWDADLAQGIVDALARDGVRVDRSGPSPAGVIHLRLAAQGRSPFWRP